MSNIAPELLTKRIVSRCGNCEICRETMADAACQFLPFLFKLNDRKKAGQGEPSPQKLRQLIDLCNACGRCPCQDVQAKIREAKDAFIAREGLPPTTRLIADVRLMGRLCGTFPRLANLMLQKEPSAGLLKRVFGIHPERKLPRFPDESFGAWAKARGITKMRESKGRKVAYFTGCTARYLFPEVAKATVEVLEHNGVNVYVPEQRCCGMPTMLEGNRDYTFELANFNQPELRRCIDAGYDIVSACPTCSYMYKSVVRMGAHFAKDYRSLVKNLMAEAEGDTARVQQHLEQEQSAPNGRVNKAAAESWAPWLLRVICSHHPLLDEGYFSSLKGVDRLRLSSHAYELGEYLQGLRQAGEFKTDFGPLSSRAAYFPPCHLREMKLGTPWTELLASVPGLRVQSVGDDYDCCGLGGIMGFKKKFHKVSLAMGRPLANKIKAMEPDRVLTDCLSCRLQFNQMLPYGVAHPVEILRDAYRGGEGRTPPARDM